jgi:hypothetical protein
MLAQSSCNTESFGSCLLKSMDEFIASREDKLCCINNES